MSDTSTLTLTVHPALALYPEMTGERVNMLAADIKENGQQEPALVFQGQLLDGRARQKACKIAGVELLTQEYDGGNPVAAILSRNLRRDMTPSQRACVAAMLCPWPRRGRPKMLKFEHLTEIVAALRAGVSRTLVQTAVYVRDHDADKFAAACRGEITVSNAKAQIEARLAESEEPGNSDGSPLTELVTECKNAGLGKLAKALTKKPDDDAKRKEYVAMLRARADSLDALANRLRALATEAEGASPVSDERNPESDMTQEQALVSVGITEGRYKALRPMYIEAAPQGRFTQEYIAKLQAANKEYEQHEPAEAKKTAKNDGNKKPKKKPATAPKPEAVNDDTPNQTADNDHQEADATNTPDTPAGCSLPADRPEVVDPPAPAIPRMKTEQAAAKVSELLHGQEVSADDLMAMVDMQLVPEPASGDPADEQHGGYWWTEEEALAAALKWDEFQEAIKPAPRHDKDEQGAPVAEPETVAA